MRIAVLGSTRGSALPLLAQALKAMPAVELALVLSNKADSGILEKAAALNIETVFLPPESHSRELYDGLVTTVLQAHKIDKIILLGYMRICSDAFTETWAGKLINVHPSLLPKHAGLMDLAVHASGFNAG